MNFFTNPDWFGRPGPFAYNTEYIIATILLVVLAFIFPILRRINDPMVAIRATIQLYPSMIRVTS